MMSGVTLTTVNTVEPLLSNPTPVRGELIFTRANVTSEPLTVSFEVAGTAEKNRDYYPEPDTWTGLPNNVWRGTVTIPANAASATAPIRPNWDQEYEKDETLQVTVLDSSGNPSTSAELVIADDDDWQVSIETKNSNDPGGTAADAVEGMSDKGYYTITRTNGTELEYDLPVEFLIQGSAKYQQDYSLSLGDDSGSFLSIAADGKSGTVKIPADDTEIILVLTADDADGRQEPDELATIQLVARPPSGQLGATGYDVGSREATVTIQDDGTGTPAVHVEALDNAADEPVSDEIADISDPGEFVIRRGGSTAAALQVWYTVLEDPNDLRDKTAEDSDYQAWWGSNPAPIYNDPQKGYYGSVTIPANSDEVRFQLAPKFDGRGNEGLENFTIHLEPPATGAAYVVDHPPGATVTIVDSGSNDTTYCFCTCGCEPVVESVNLNDGKVTNVHAPTGLINSSKDNPHPIITADVRLQPAKEGANLAGVEAVLDLGGVRSQTVYYSAAGVQPDQPYRFALQAMLPTLKPEGTTTRSP